LLEDGRKFKARAGAPPLRRHKDIHILCKLIQEERDTA